MDADPEHRLYSLCDIINSVIVFFSTDTFYGFQEEVCLKTEQTGEDAGDRCGVGIR